MVTCASLTRKKVLLKSGVFLIRSDLGYAGDGE